MLYHEEEITSTVASQEVEISSFILEAMFIIIHKNIIKIEK